MNEARNEMKAGREKGNGKEDQKGETKRDTQSKGARKVK